MAQSEEDDFLLSGEAAGGGDSDEEIEVTAAEVLVQLEDVSFSIIIADYPLEKLAYGCV